MKNNFLKGIALGAICLIGILSCVPVIASTSKKNVEATYKNIKLFVYGEEKKVSQEPFIIGGTTFVPLRFISEALGETVDWDGKTNSIYIGGKPSDIRAISPIEAENILRQVLEINEEGVEYLGLQNLEGTNINMHTFMVRVYPSDNTNGFGIPLYYYVEQYTGIVYDEQLEACN